MAQQDTGLGWSAKEEWLTAGAGTIASIANFGGDDFPGQPIPETGNSDADVIANGFTVMHGTTSNRPAAFKIGCTTAGAKIVVFLLTNAVMCVCSNISGATFRYVWYYTNNDQVISGRSGTCDASSGVPGIYTQRTAGQLMPDYTFDAPTFATANDGYNAIDTTAITITKLEPGYAVVCAAEWYTPEGNVPISPVLISTVPENIVMSTDGTTPAPNLSTFSFLLNGARFYMAILGGNSDPVTTAYEYADLKQFGAALPSKIFNMLASGSFANILISNAPDPYGENTEVEGGDGTDPDDDPVVEETLPLPVVVGLGFSTIYVPTQADLYSLAAYMWGGNLDLDNFLKLFANPMDSILGLSAVPLVLSGTYEPIYLGGQQLQGVTMPRYTGRTSVKVDMGTTTIKERWGAYLDYDPYTELAIYVPFIGIKNIKADDVMGKTVRLMYNIDILSGACVAYLRTEGGSVLYEWSGQCAVQLPITGANWDNIFSTAVSTAATLGGALFAPASAPVLGGAVASAAVQAVAAKPRIERSGAMNGITGFLGQLRPYIIRSTPEAYIPGDQNKFIGYPSYMSVNLGELTGYNEIASVHLENIPATGDELAELESILKGGVIF